MSFKRAGLRPERSPTHCDLLRSGSYGVPFASAWRDRGEKKEFGADSMPSP